ncbi:Ig-like domain-containing protein, partial [Burkholderia pyrrocinia]|uniref:Ig-like domain-containing protein n=1 Tax=Burkholderia pyrrocinia TaxID=60550 RepID=UPI0010EA702E
MSANTVRIAVVDGKTITQTIDVQPMKQGASGKIRAIPHGKYILIDDQTGVAPENINVKRVGKDLHVSFEGAAADESQLIVEDYYGQGGELVGKAADGEYYDYIAADAQDDHQIAALMDNGDSALVLGRDVLSGFGAGLVAAPALGWLGPAMLGLLGAGIVGGVAAAIVNSNKDDNDSGNGGGHSPNPLPQPSIGFVYDEAGRITGPIGPGTVTDDTSPKFTGTGTPGNTIVIFDNGKAIGSVNVGDDGNWEFKPNQPLDNGDHKIVVVEQDGNGNMSPPSSEFDFTIDDRGPNAPSVGEVFDNAGPVTGPLTNGGFTDDPRPRFTGMGQTPHDTIEVWNNGKLVGTTTVQSDGTWEFRPSEDLGNGSYDFTFVEVDNLGRVSNPSNGFSLVIDTNAPPRPLIDNVHDDVAPHMGIVNRDGLTNDDTPTLNGRGQIDAIIYIYDNGGTVPIASEKVKLDGTWTVTLDSLPDGDHSFTAIAQGPNGAQSAPSLPYPITIDTTPPATPEIG